ncbi:MAG: hypothetical protein JWP57_4314 [Spirosoma sp.]|nr:hypothetical protein [Spirosoma sp.]
MKSLTRSNSMIMLILSIIGQYTLAIIFIQEAREALSSKAGTYRLIEYILAALMYASLGTLLTWLLMTRSG